LPVHGRRNRVELANVVGPGELDLKSATSAIVTNAANPNIIHQLTFHI
jgi:hypothetical protein